MHTPKPPLTIRATLLLIVGALNLLIAILVSVGVYRAWDNFQRAQTLKTGAAIVSALYNANKSLSLTRAATVAMMGAAQVDADLHRELLSNRAEVDRNVEYALANVNATLNSVVASAFIRIDNKYKILIERRKQVDKMLVSPLPLRDFSAADQFCEINSALISEIQRAILLYSREYQRLDATADRQAMFNYFVWELAEYSGQEYAIVGQLIAQSKTPTQFQRQELIRLRENIEKGWEVVRKYYLSEENAEKLLPQMEEVRNQFFFIFEQIDELLNVGGAGEAITYPIGAELWLGISSQAVESLLDLQNNILVDAQGRVDKIEVKARFDIFFRLGIFILSIGISFYCWTMIARRVVQPIDEMVTALYRATEDDIFEMPKIRYYHDEIGKLARVLEVFRYNSLKMKQSNEELERFAFLAAHDLKSPLRAVANISEWLEEDLVEILPDSSKHHLKELRRRVSLMDKLLDDTLAYARVSAKLESKPYESISGLTLINEIVQLLEPPPGFRVNIGKNLAYVQLQKYPLWQVLYNLINNAIKHHDKANGIITIELEHTDKDYIFYVGDDGPGIAPQFHKKIFEMFQTLKYEDHNQGRGMGLAMVRKIVVTYGGAIAIDSELGCGCVFRFTWPKAAPYTIREHTEEVRLKNA